MKCEKFLGTVYFCKNLKRYFIPYSFDYFIHSANLFRNNLLLRIPRENDNILDLNPLRKT